MPSGSRWFIFTINNPDNDARAGLLWDVLASSVQPNHLVGGVYQLEKGEGGTLHCQGVFHVQHQVLLKSMKNKFHSRLLRGWVDICRDHEKARLYCSKEDSRVAGPWYHGDVDEHPIKSQGRRTDLEDAIQHLQDGMDLRATALTFPSQYVKYHRGLEKLTEIIVNRPKRTTMTKLLWISGAAGRGKTTMAAAIAKAFAQEDVYYKTLGKAQHVDWWNGYTQQKVVIIEDMDEMTHLDLQAFKLLVEKIPHQVRTSPDVWMQFNSKLIIITSNPTPWEIYDTEIRSNANHHEAVSKRVSMHVQVRPEDIFISDLEAYAQDILGQLGLDFGLSQ